MIRYWNFILNKRFWDYYIFFDKNKIFILSDVIWTLDVF